MHQLCRNVTFLVYVPGLDFNVLTQRFLPSAKAALQKQQIQADLMVQGTLESTGFCSGEPVAASAAGPLCAASATSIEETPTVNGGQSDSYSESMDREPEPEPAEEVSENGPLLG